VTIQPPVGGNWFTRCRSCCRRSFLCCAECALSLPLCLCGLQIPLFHWFRRPPLSVTFSLLQRNVSSNVCFLQSYLISGGLWSLVWFHWRLYRLKYVYFQTVEYGKNTGGDWYTHMFGPANACAFAHRLSACQQCMVQTDRHKFHPAATLGGACSGLSQSLWMLYRSSTEALGIIEQLNDHIPEW